MTDLQRYGGWITKPNPPFSRSTHLNLKRSLIALSKAHAKKAKQPAHRFLPNRHLQKILKFRPNTEDELLRLNVAQVERQSFNNQVLKAIQDAKEADKDCRTPISDFSESGSAEYSDEGSSSSDEDSDQDPCSNSKSFEIADEF